MSIYKENNYPFRRKIVVLLVIFTFGFSFLGKTNLARANELNNQQDFLFSNICHSDSEHGLTVVNNDIMFDLTRITSSHKVEIASESTDECRNNIKKVSFVQNNDFVESLVIEGGTFYQRTTNTSQLEEVHFEGLNQNTALKIGENAFKQEVFGQLGSSGSNGDKGADGAKGSCGGATCSGDNGSPGSNAQAGDKGADASTSLRLLRFPEKLRTLNIESGAFELLAIGGAGGKGGNGGDGGNGGGAKGSGVVHSGSGANAGSGARGGDGGNASTTLRSVIFPDMPDNRDVIGANDVFRVESSAFKQTARGGNGGRGGDGGKGGDAPNTTGTSRSGMNGGNGGNNGSGGNSGEARTSLETVTFGKVNVNFGLGDESFKQLALSGNYGDKGVNGAKGHAGKGPASYSGKDGSDGANTGSNGNQNTFRTTSLSQFSFNTDQVPGFAPDTVYLGEDVTAHTLFDDESDKNNVIWQWLGSRGCSNSHSCENSPDGYLLNLWGTNINHNRTNQSYYIDGSEPLGDGDAFMPDKAPNLIKYLVSGVDSLRSFSVESITPNVCNPQTDTEMYNSTQMSVSVMVNLTDSGDCLLRYGNRTDTLKIYSISYDRTVGIGRTPDTIYAIEGTVLDLPKVGLENGTFKAPEGLVFKSFKNSYDGEEYNEGDRYVVPNLYNNSSKIIFTAHYKLTTPIISPQNMISDQLPQISVNQLYENGTMHYITISEGSNQNIEPTCQSEALAKNIAVKNLPPLNAQNKKVLIKVIACPENSQEHVVENSEISVGSYALKNVSLTYDLNEGVIEKSRDKYKIDIPYGSVPILPESDISIENYYDSKGKYRFVGGYQFEGWYLEEGGQKTSPAPQNNSCVGKKVFDRNKNLLDSSFYINSDDKVLYACWLDEEKPSLDKISDLYLNNPNKAKTLTLSGESDNTTPLSQIKYCVVYTPNINDCDDKNKAFISWETGQNDSSVQFSFDNYIPEKEWKLYVYLKDLAGNISDAYQYQDTEYQIDFCSDIENTTISSLYYSYKRNSKTVNLPFDVYHQSDKKPKIEGAYFAGWQVIGDNSNKLITDTTYETSSFNEDLLAIYKYETPELEDFEISAPSFDDLKDGYIVGITHNYLWRKKGDSIFNIAPSSQIVDNLHAGDQIEVVEKQHNSIRQSDILTIVIPKALNSRHYQIDSTLIKEPNIDQWHIVTRNISNSPVVISDILNEPDGFVLDEDACLDVYLGVGEESVCQVTTDKNIMSGHYQTDYSASVHNVEGADYSEIVDFPGVLSFDYQKSPEVEPPVISQPIINTNEDQDQNNSQNSTDEQNNIQNDVVILVKQPPKKIVKKKKNPKKLTKRDLLKVHFAVKKISKTKSKAVLKVSFQKTSYLKFVSHLQIRYKKAGTKKWYIKTVPAKILKKKHPSVNIKLAIVKKMQFEIRYITKDSNYIQKWSQWSEAISKNV